MLLKPEETQSDSFLDYDFQLLQPNFEVEDNPTQYFVFKRDLDIYYIDILNEVAMKDPNTNFNRV